MPIRVVLQDDHAFQPEEVTTLCEAFDLALQKLRLVDRQDPVTMAVANLIVELAKRGERDPARLCDAALERLTKR